MKTVKKITKKKYQDGGSYRDQKKSAKQDQKLAAINAKTERIKAGTEPSTYDKVSNITGNVAKTAASAAQVANAVKDTRAGMSGPGMKKGGLVKKQNGGATSDIKSGAKQIAKGVKKGVNSTVKTAKTAAKTAVKATPEYQTYKAAGKAMKSVDDSLQKRYPNYTGKGSFYDGAKQAVKTVMGYKKGGTTKVMRKK